jgi:hypothetical protein
MRIYNRLLGIIHKKSYISSPQALITMAPFPTWALDRVTYWMIFALIVLSIEWLGRNMDWNLFSIGPRLDKIITIIVLLGIAFLFLWLIFHP